MDDIAVQLAETLRARRALIANAESRSDSQQHIAKLRAVSEKIEALWKKLVMPVHPQLAHFLDRASYDKALAFLEQNSEPPRETRSQEI
ncbi:MAG: hypothetical protein ABI871_04270 [Chthoniobacterales bacterium]